MILRKILVSFSVLLLLCTHVNAAITLTNNFWSTSFSGCATGDVSTSWDCDGMEISDSYTCSSSTQSDVETSYNRDGSSGYGFRKYFEGGERNVQSMSPTIRFSSPQTSVWLRFYYRIPSGQTMSSIGQHKIFYAYTDADVAVNVNWPGGSTGTNVSVEPRNTTTSDWWETTINSWNGLYGASDTGDPANGTWHYFELYLKLGTTGSDNGEIRLWVDGVLSAEKDDMDWFDGGTSSPTGWDNITVTSNHDTFSATGCAGHDIDDIAVATSGYTGFTTDGSGNDMIGPLETQATTASLTCSKH